MGKLTERDWDQAWLDYETEEPIPLDEGNAAYDKWVRMLKHAFRAGYIARSQNTPDSRGDG